MRWTDRRKPLNFWKAYVCLFPAAVVTSTYLMSVDTWIKSIYSSNIKQENRIDGHASDISNELADMFNVAVPKKPIQKKPHG